MFTPICYFMLKFHKPNLISHLNPNFPPPSSSLRSSCLLHVVHILHYCCSADHQPPAPIFLVAIFKSDAPFDDIEKTYPGKGQKITQFILTNAFGRSEYEVLLLRNDFCVYVQCCGKLTDMCSVHSGNGPSKAQMDNWTYCF